MEKGDTRERDHVAAAVGAVSLSGADMREFLAAVLALGVPFRFTARGHSMYPFIRDADVITVSPLGGCAPRVGDVVALRSGEDRLVVHRIVAAGDARRDPAAGYLVRGDNCLEADGLMPPEAVLGVVTRVERAGRPRRFGIGLEAAALARLSRAGTLRPATTCLRLPRNVGRGALKRVQSTPACRRFLWRLRPSFALVGAVAADEAELAQRFGLRADLRPRGSGKEVTAFVARRDGEAGRIIGFVELVRRHPSAAPFDGFWVHATVVATRYRGMGVAEALMRQAIAVARCAGAEELRLTVFADNAPALALYRKLGFEPGGSPELVERLATETRRDSGSQVPLRLTLGSAYVERDVPRSPGSVDAAEAVA